MKQLHIWFSNKSKKIKFKWWKWIMIWMIKILDYLHMYVHVGIRCQPRPRISLEKWMMIFIQVLCNWAYVLCIFLLFSHWCENFVYLTTIKCAYRYHYAIAKCLQIDDVMQTNMRCEIHDSIKYIELIIIHFSLLFSFFFSSSS